MGFGSFKDRIKQAADQVSGTVSQAADTVTSAVGDVADQAASAASEVADQAGAAVAGAVEQAEAVGAAGVDQISGGLSPWADKIGQLGQAGAGLVGTGGGLLSVGQAAAGRGGFAADVPEVPAEVEIRLNGQSLDAKQVWVERIQVRRAVNEIPTATVLLNMPQAPHDDYATLNGLLKQGAIGRTFSMKSGKLTLFSGVVATVQVELGETGRRLRVRLKHGLQGLKARHVSRILKKGTDASVVKQVLSEHGVKADVTMPAGEASQRVQWNCTDWTFVRALAGQHGAWLWPQADGGVKVRPPKLGGKSHRIAATPQTKGMTLLDAQWSYSGLMQPQQVQTKSWDLGKQVTVTKTAKPASLGAGGLAPNRVKPLKDESWMALLTGQWDPAIQQSTTDAWMTQQFAQTVRGHWTVAGCQAIELGDTVELAGFGDELGGKSIVTQVEYEIDTTLRVGKTIVGVGLEEEAAVPPPLPVPTGLVIAKVAKHQADPKAATWNRMPVTVPALGTTVLWARIGHPYASTDSGLTFYPEPDDEVALGFVGEDPVILASLHNPKQKAPFAPSAKNEKKGIVLRHDKKRLELSFDRDKHVSMWGVGQDSALEQQVTVSEEQGLTFVSKKGQVKIDVEKGDVTWTTKKNFKVDATETITLAGKTGVKASSDKDVSLDAKLKLVGQGKEAVKWTSEKSELSINPQKAVVTSVQTTVKGTAKVNMSGAQGVSVSGAKIDVKGDASVGVSAAKVDVKGEAAVSVGGAEVKLNGEAQASLTGATVKVEGQATTNVGGSGVTNVKGSLVNLG
ncbi:contractile injection system protein, VgrG/Pvc8 family [Burkholderia stagnalis]|uniref:contractile injection system protein, VgrG/Pvc8 family n=1 Tax=Burkholderia stagnalis TaxID=1503054 RepID=UPI000759380D|nr:contractile injection system protein, VgrG/Pvc8 family [Burkholderia stagnalis]KWI28416.1 hypothetical protein WT71_16265 [Burkholderia stagnalis]KWI71003.1 hypothetical protein WT73_14050 [Burkholderia stagnalis]MDY7806687.1 contractile injection system protein, VgrG/Pvc8 family [Burkholderia stagnalis]